MSYRYTSYSESDIDSGRVLSGSNRRYDIKVNQWGLPMLLGGSWAVAVNIQDETYRAPHHGTTMVGLLRTVRRPMTKSMLS